MCCVHNREDHAAGRLAQGPTADPRFLRSTLAASAHTHVDQGFLAGCTLAWTHYAAFRLPWRAQAYKCLTSLLKCTITARSLFLYFSLYSHTHTLFTPPLITRFTMRFFSAISFVALLAGAAFGAPSTGEADLVVRTKSCRSVPTIIAELHENLKTPCGQLSAQLCNAFPT